MYANGATWLPDRILRAHVLFLLAKRTFESVPYIDDTALCTIRNNSDSFRAMAKVGGTRAFLVMLLHPTTKKPCTVVLDRCGKMRVITLTYRKFAPDTILDGVVTRKSYTDEDGDICRYANTRIS